MPAVFVASALVLAVLALAGCSGSSDSGSGPSLEVPGVPQGVSVTPDDGTLAVAWQTVAQAETYEVKWGTAAAETKTGITAPGCLITSLTNTQTYPVQVRAKNSAGESDWSEPVNGTPAAQTNAPSAPAAAPSVSASGDRLTVTWTAVQGATKYQVFYGTSASPTMQYGSDTTATSVDITVTNNGTWYVRIKAGNSVGFSDYGPAGNATVSGIQTAIGSWTRESSSGSTYTYTFGENGKLILTTVYSGGSPYTSYYYYDPASKEFYPGTRTDYTLDGDTLRWSYSIWTSDDHDGLIGTWTQDGSTMEISASTVTLAGQDPRPYYTYSEASTDYVVYQDADEPAGHYAFSGVKLSISEIYRTEYQRQGMGTGLVGTWGVDWDETTWTFTDNTATRERPSREPEEYSYNVSGSKITIEERLGTLNGNTFSGSSYFRNTSFTRVGSGSGMVGNWTAGTQTMGAKLTITQNELTFTYAYGGESGGETMPIRISGNNLYGIAYTCTLEGDRLVFVEEDTDEFTRVE
jgi:hypothetical protein